MRALSSVIILLTLSCSEAVGSAANYGVKCTDLEVTISADELKIPWYPKEHYIEVDNEPESAITCTLKADEKNGRQVSKVMVEWLYYPEYINLVDLKEDYDLVHVKGGVSQLQDQPCRFPVSNQVNAGITESKLPMCLDRNVKGVAITLHHDPSNRSYTSQLVFNKAILGHTGSYQCRWRWENDSSCLKEASKRGEMELLHLLGHSPQRSATIYVKVYEGVDYSRDLVTVMLAALLLLIVLGILWCLETKLSDIKKTMVPVDHL